jgi:hypothetical protein
MTPSAVSLPASLQTVCDTSGALLTGCYQGLTTLRGKAQEIPRRLWLQDCTEIERAACVGGCVGAADCEICGREGYESADNDTDDVCFR